MTQLLDRVSKGEKITIEKHGEPLAFQQSTAPSKTKPARDVIYRLKRFRSSCRLYGFSIRDMIEAGTR
jgi:hypothetical protein